MGIKKYRFSKWVYIAKKINALRAPEPKETEGIEKEEESEKVQEIYDLKKILIVGLDNAGKTTLLHFLQDNVKLDILRKLPPTMGVERVKINKLDSDLIFWDMGGQIQFRNEYLQNAEKYFTNIDLLIFVIDIQEPEKYSSAIKYLEDILKTIIDFKENPEFLILLHKVDPDIKENKEIQDSIQKLATQIVGLFEKTDLKYEMSTYSIYNYLGANKNVISEIRNCLKPPLEEKEDITKHLGNSIERVLNIIINLSASIEERFINLEGLVENIREWVDNMKGVMQNKSAIARNKYEVIRSLDDLGQVKTIRSELKDELKSVLKLRKAE